MVKKALILFLSGILLLSFLTHSSQTILTDTQQQEMDKYQMKETNKLFGILEIPSIQLKNPIYNLDEAENNVEKNIQLLEENTKEKALDWIVLASHSGTGQNAYFTNLNQLKINEKIYLQKDQTTYEYRFFKKEEVKKSSTLEVDSYNFPVLIMITCSETKNNIQEIYYAKRI